MAMGKLSLKYKALIALVLTGVVYYAGDRMGWLPGKLTQKSEVPQAFEMAQEGDVATADTPSTVAAVPLPTARPSTQRRPPIRVNIPAWNATMGLMFANGGPITTGQSLMEKHGLTVRIARQNNFEVTKGEQVKFAQALANGTANPADGVHYAVIMGDGAAVYLAGINKLLEKLGPDYRAEIVGALGYSRGEDGYWGPADWKDNPDAQKGAGVAGVLRDGDWNIALYKIANDGIKNNPDETTWDPDALNWFAVDDYLKAVELYVKGYCEDRVVVRNGKKTNEPKHHVCVDAVVTWTPGDVNLAKQKGGLIRLLSTAENIYQMPAVVIGIHKWNVDNAKKVEEFLTAAFEGAEQVKANPKALSVAARVSATVYNEEDAAYWARYYRGVIEPDKTGVRVPLGGSTVANLGDNLVLFGLAEGSGGVGSSVFRAAYEGFGNMAKQQYPTLVPDFPKTGDAVNTQFLQALSQHQPKAESQAEVAEFQEQQGPIAQEQVVAKRDWSIQFDTGKATFTPAARKTLDDLYNALAVGGAMTVQIDGHTDNVGTPEGNKALSEQRAEAVRTYLQERAPTLFPANRVTVQAFGQDQPKASNATPEGRAINRRVTVTLGMRS